MAAVTIDTSNPYGNAASTTGDGTDGNSTNTTSTDGKSGCSLLPGAGEGGASFLFVFMGAAIWALRSFARKGREKA